MVAAQLQAMVEKDPVLPPRATLSFTDYMMEANRLFAGGNPQFLPHRTRRCRCGTSTTSRRRSTPHWPAHSVRWTPSAWTGIAAYAYRSFVLIPVNLSNFLLVAAMNVLGIGLDINAVIVAVMGVGVGIDYGIYLLSRICEEFTAHEHNWEKAISAALTAPARPSCSRRRSCSPASCPGTSCPLEDPSSAQQARRLV